MCRLGSTVGSMRVRVPHETLGGLYTAWDAVCGGSPLEAKDNVPTPIQFLESCPSGLRSLANVGLR